MAVVLGKMIWLCVDGYIFGIAEELEIGNISSEDNFWKRYVL